MFSYRLYQSFFPEEQEQDLSSVMSSDDEEDENENLDMMLEPNNDDHNDEERTIASFLSRLFRDETPLTANDDEALQTIFTKRPELCGVPFRWSCCSCLPQDDFEICYYENDDNGHYVLPLLPICTKRPSLKLIEIVYHAFPQAISRYDPVLQRLPLHWACIGRASLKVVTFLANNYERALPTKCRNRYPSHARLPLHYAAVATKNDDIFLPEVISFLIKRYPASLEIPDRHGNLALHLATSFAVVRLLIDANDSALEHRNKSLWQPLHSAIAHDASPRIIRYLVDKKNKKETTIVNKSVGMEPLYWACNLGGIISTEVIHFLLSEHDGGAAARDVNGDLPLHWICRGSTAEENLHYVVSEFRRGVSMRNINGQLPLQIMLSTTVPSPETLRLLISEYPESLELVVNGEQQRQQHFLALNKSPWHIEHADWNTRAIWVRRRTATDDDDNSTVRNAMVWGRSDEFSQQDEVDYRMLVFWCHEKKDVIKTTEILQQQQDVESLVAVGGGMSSNMVPYISRALKVNDALVSLALGKNPIGNVGAESLATALSSKANLESLDLHDCSIGIAGLSHLLKALEGKEYLTDLNLSYNPDIFNAQGGKRIANALSKMEHLKRFHLYRDEQGPDFGPCFAELVEKLRWSPTNWPILLNRLTSRTWHIVDYYRSDLHNHVISSRCAYSLWPYILERVLNITYQNNEEMIYFYVRGMPEKILQFVNGNGAAA